MMHRDFEDAGSAVDQAKPVPERARPTVRQPAPAAVQDAVHPVNLPVQRCHPELNPQQDGHTASNRSADGAEALDKAGQSARAAPQQPHTAAAAPQAPGNWLPRSEEGDQHKAWQGASRDAARTADMQVHLDTALLMSNACPAPDD